MNDCLTFRMRCIALLTVIFGLLSCTGNRKLAPWPVRKSFLTGHDFYQSAVAMQWRQRDSFAVKEILEGNIPGFIKKLAPVHITIKDSVNGKWIRAVFYVTPDYMSVGTNDNWARIPLTAMAAQQIADSLHCFLPTPKMVDAIYMAAKVKLEPVPMYAFRDSTVTMWQHHLIIEGQRKGKKGLIAGIKKDVVISGKITNDPKPNREAIYGWHKPGGKPIQPLYTGHVNWYVDYSHGIRLVYRRIRVNGHWMDYTEILKDPLLQRLLCNDGFCDFTRYAY
ncbi:MAG: hypothetical protein JSU05_09400 [Bacteroidetes bacterium]|nr:hypothetical protein [Bacteroidota bacterium]